MSGESEARSWRPSASRNGEVIEKVRQIVMEDVVVTPLLPRDGGTA